MDGKGRATDNAHIERFFRTIKYKRIYLEHPVQAMIFIRFVTGLSTITMREEGILPSGITRQKSFTER